MKKLKRIILWLIILGIFAIIYSYIEPYWYQIKASDETSSDIPKGFKGTKIVFIADIHHSDFFSLGRVKDLVRRVNDLKPDLILLGGDYVNWSSEYIEPCFNELKKLQAPLGKYGVMGNHDHWENAELTAKCSKTSDITLLDNKDVWIYRNEDRIKLGGVGDVWTDKQDLKPTLEDVSETDYVILLSHNPDYVEQIKDKRIDLVLSGHTHGGQLTLFGLWSPLTPSAYGNKYMTGTIRSEYTKVIVTNGIGTVGYQPMRFFARPQINVIYLQ